MKKLVILILAFLILPRPGLATSARMFQFQNQDRLSFQLEASEWNRLSNKVYSFVSSYIPDPRPQEPIEIVFDPELDCAGFTSRSQESSKESLRQIHINTKIRSQVDYQVILAHELTHVLRHMYQPDEAYWLDEGLAKWMEWKYISEFPKELVTTLNAQSVIRLIDKPLSCNEPGGSDYASSYFFILYLRNHLGGDAFIEQIGKSREKSWDNIEHSAQSLQSAGVISIDPHLLHAQTLLQHFAFAVTLNDPFLADYALFQLDQKYLPSQQQVLKVLGSPPSSSQCTTYEIRPSANSQPQIREISTIPARKAPKTRYIQACF